MASGRVVVVARFWGSGSNTARRTPAGSAPGDGGSAVLVPERRGRAPRGGVGGFDWLSSGGRGAGGFTAGIPASEGLGVGGFD